MDRLQRLLRLARLRGDRAAELILTGKIAAMWTEAEMREAWGK